MIKTHEITNGMNGLRVKKVPFLDCGQFQCILVNDRDGFRELLLTLSRCKKRALGFGLKSSYIYHIANSCQKGVLFQIAYGNVVWLIDIYVLGSILKLAEWEIFFEIVFRYYPIGFDIEKTVMLLRSTFPFLRDYIYDNQIHVFDVQEAVNELSMDANNNTKRFFKGQASNSPLFHDMTTAILNEHLKRKEPEGENWITRPLTKSQMLQAAQDAHFTLKCYEQMRALFLTLSNKNEWQLFTSSLFKIPDNRSKKSFDEVIENLKYDAIKIPRETTIVLDKTLIEYSEVLQYCGFKTWDYRNILSSSLLRPRDIDDIMYRYLRELKYRDPEVLETTYILSKKKTLYLEGIEYENRLITVSNEESPLMVINKILKKTNSTTNFSHIFL